jgi:catechol 2,3-dioxygenase-like lactoylglutathione lyase family enzyme
VIDRIDHIVMNCRDVEATASWYERALGFERETYQRPAEHGQRLALKFGRQKLNLRPTGSPGWVTCKVDVLGSLDLCFITEGSLKPIIERWKSYGIPITPGPAPRTGAFGRMTSIYCEDPDGNLVEIATYSADP